MNGAPSLVEQRQVRVFVSSTFRDMAAERDHLVKFIFPQLRKLAESRGVTWGEVDLRWGITDEQAAEGKVLPLCLAEIAGCRPYFIGLLGERYGWVPKAIDPEIEKQQPWLKQHRQLSVTELEILHGVLNDLAMADHAFFYFRAPAFVNGIEPAKRSDFLSENSEAAAKLAALKEHVRTAHAEGKLAYAPRENYAGPEALGALVLDDFTQLIERLYPEAQVPDAVERECQAHDAYARSRLRAYVPRPAYTQRLDAYAAGDDPAPFVVLGESGCGKSALLADWAMRYRAAHPQELVLLHFIGGTADSADWVHILRRIMGELKKAFSLADEIPFEPAKVREAFPTWLTNVAARGRVILVLDALNQLEDKDAAPDLGWLPNYWPPNIRFIFSTLPGRALDALKGRAWLASERSMELPLFTVAERSAAIGAFLALYRKELNEARKRRLAEAPQCANPLFLRAALDELRQFGEHDRLDERIGYYLAANDPGELFTRILERWQGDYSAGRDLVRQALSLIGASRRGLSEAELLDLLGEKGTPLPRAHWTPFHLAAESALANRGGLLNFGHAYLHAAVAALWLNQADALRSARQRLTDYFAAIAQPTDRKLDELPWLLFELEDWNRLKEVLTDIPTFLQMHQGRWEWELHGYWVTLGGRIPAAQTYGEALNAWLAADARDPAATSSVLNELAVFHFERADHASAEPLYRRALAMDGASFGKYHPKVAIRLNNLAVLLQETNRLAEAEPLFRRALAIDEASFGKDHPNVARDLNNLAALLKDTNRPAEAEPLLRRAVAIDEASLGKDHPNVARGLNNLAQLLDAGNRLAEAEPLYRRALAIDEASFGKGHPNVAIRLSNLAQLLQDVNRLAEAEPLMRRVVAIFEKSLGADHPNVATAFNNLAQLFQDTNRLAEAEPLLRRALAIHEASFGNDHPEVATDLNNLAALLAETNRLSEAEPLMRRALAIDEASFGKDHPNVATRLNNLAVIMQDTNRLAEAEPLMRRALAIDEASLGKDHPKVATRHNNLAQLLQATNRLAEAEPLQRRALAIDEASFGRDHPNVATRLNNLAQLLKATNRLAEAEPLMRRALAIWERSLGSEHPSVASALNNLAALLHATNRLAEAEPIMRRALEIMFRFKAGTGHEHPRQGKFAASYRVLLSAMGRSEEEVLAALNAVGAPFGISFGG